MLNGGYTNVELFVKDFSTLTFQRLGIQLFNNGDAKENTGAYGWYPRDG